ncbi:hypothetical protein SNEBB_002996 [Seison nebaliae]|nr:hypothetical protein SNEBB_002996 [Seison nebaliae]
MINSHVESLTDSSNVSLINDNNSIDEDEDDDDIRFSVDGRHDFRPSQPLLRQYRRSNDSDTAFMNDIGTLSADDKLIRKSIFVTYLVMMISSLSFSICLPSLWPYLRLMDNESTTTFFGWVVASYSVGQLIFSPVFGWLGDKTSSTKIPLLITTSFSILANLLYMYIASLDFHSFRKKWLILIARTFIGIGSANIAVIRSYASEVVKPEKKNAIMTNLSAMQAIGFIIGPLLQAVMTLLGFPGIVEMKYFHCNMYTAPALLSIFLLIISTFCIICFFSDINQSKFRLTVTAPINMEIPNKSSKIPIISLNCLFFITMTIFCVFETLATPICIDMYAWTKKEATKNTGIILGGIGAFSIFVFLGLKYLSKKTRDVNLLFVGFALCAFSFLFAILPFSSIYPALQSSDIHPHKHNHSYHQFHNNSTTTHSPLTTSTTNTINVAGCPLNYDWCYTQTIITLWQFILSIFICSIGYGTCNVITYTMYSKIIDRSKDQGLFMGYLTSSGSLARAIAPVTITMLYERTGLRVSYGVVLTLTIIALVLVGVNYKQFKKLPKAKSTKKAPRRSGTI